MSVRDELEGRPVHYHDCPMLGPNVPVMEATMLSTDQRVVLGHQLKCLCGYTAGPFKPGPGVTVIEPGRYSVDMTKAEFTTPHNAVEAEDKAS